MLCNVSPDQAGCWVTTEADMIVTLLINPPLINCPTNDHCYNNNLIRVEDLSYNYRDWVNIIGQAGELQKKK